MYRSQLSRAPRWFGGGSQDFGQILRRTLLFEFDYGLTDRLELNFDMPVGISTLTLR